MVRIVFEGREAIDSLTAGADAAGRLGDEMRVIAQRLRSDCLRNFREGGWFPEKWQPSARVRTFGGQTLVDRAILRNSIHADSSATAARIGTEVKYAGVHQGRAGFSHTIIRPKNKKALRFRVAGGFVMVRQVSIPRRPFLPVDDQGNLPEATQAFIRQRLTQRIGGAA